MNPTPRTQFSTRWIVGIALIALGLLFLLMNIGLIHHFPVWKFWPVVLIAIGIARMRQPYKRADGFWLLALGVWLQVSMLRLWGLDFGDTWPFILIALGIFWMWGGIEREALRKARTSINSSSTSSTT